VRRLGNSAQAVQLSAVLRAPRAGNNFTTDVVMCHRIIDNSAPAAHRKLTTQDLHAPWLAVAALCTQSRRGGRSTG